MKSRATGRGNIVRRNDLRKLSLSRRVPFCCFLRKTTIKRSKEGGRSLRECQSLLCGSLASKRKQKPFDETITTRSTVCFVRPNDRKNARKMSYLSKFRFFYGCCFLVFNHPNGILGRAEVLSEVNRTVKCRPCIYYGSIIGRPALYV